MGTRTIMQHFRKIIIIILYVCCVNQTAFADPWFTGPLLAPAGHTVPRGHTNFEIYGIDIFTDGQYNQSGDFVRIPLFRTFVANPILTHGFTDWLDVQFTVPYAFNSTRGQRSNRLTDVSVALGIQLLEQKGDPHKIDFRILVQETIPTGKFDHLNPVAAGTDATGLGSYQTQVGLNFQYLRQVFNNHYLRTRLILSRLHANPVNISGLSSYGGTINTRGTISSWNENDIDLAFEYTLTQHWVAVMEGYISSGESTRFNGILNIANIGSPPTPIGSGEFREKALAPALEYNFNSNIGLIGGVWFPVSGVNTAHYMTYMLALNAFW